MNYKFVEIRLPNGTSAEIEIVHLDELLRRGIRDTQGTVLYWQGEGNPEAADAMRSVKTDGERIRNLLKPSI